MPLKRKIISSKEIKKVQAKKTKVSQKTPKKIILSLAKTKTEPKVESLIKIIRSFRDKPEVKQTLLTSFTEIISKRKKEWSKLNGAWQVFLTLEKIGAENK